MNTLRTRPQTRWQIRKSAARAFQLRNRTGVDRLRPPAGDETPLSQDEIWHGIRNGLIAAPRAQQEQGL